MFPTAPDPLRSRLLRGVDRVIEFATLGEYGASQAGFQPLELGPAHAGGAMKLERRSSAASLERTLPCRLPTEPSPRPGGPRPQRIRPATAAARRREEPVAPPQRVSTRLAVRSMAISGNARLARPPQARVREGAVAPAPQPCVAADV